MLSRFTSLGILPVLLLFAGCGSEKHQLGVAELQRVQASIHEMDIVVAAGTSQIEFSRRLTDSLLKVGDLQQDRDKTLNSFSKSEQSTVMDIYQHLSQALEAYKESKDFFGDTHKEDLDPLQGHNLFQEPAYEALQNQFPSLEQIPPALEYSGNKEYWKGDMLQALWKVAGQEDITAKQLIDQLNHK
jgi:hypothetical protein